MSAADDEQLEAAVALDTEKALERLDAPAPADDPQPKRKSRSGTSGAERRRRARAAAGESTDAPKRATRPRATRTQRVNIKAGVEQLYTLAGVGVSMAPMLDANVRTAVGTTMAAQAGACAEAWDKLAKENDRVRSALESLLTVSSVGVLVAAHLPIVLAGVTAARPDAAAQLADLTATPAG